MAVTSLSDLPAELLLRITENLALDDLKALSSVTSQYRKLLVPSLFKTLKSTNRECDADAIRRVVQNYGRHVTKLFFECHLAPNREDDDVPDEEAWLDDNKPDGNDENNTDGEASISSRSDEEDMSSGDGAHVERVPSVSTDDKPWIQPGFSKIAQDLLIGRKLPNLKITRVSFHPLDNFNTKAGSWGGACEIGEGTSLYIHERLETDEERLTDERKYKWRQDLNLAFKCLSKNTLIESLVLDRLIPKAVSPFFDPSWPLLLARLKHFEVGLWGGDNTAGWHSGHLEGYTDFVTSLHEHMFQHLGSVQQLVFRPDSDSMVGRDGMTPLLPSALMNIRHLTIENCLVDRPLETFIKSRSQQLETLCLVNCFSTYSVHFGPADNAMTWATFLRSIRDHRPILEKLEISYHGKHEVELFPEDEDLCRKKLIGAGKWSRRFGHGQIDDKYGDLMQDGDTNAARLLDGEDQKEFDVLMELVEQNRPDVVSNEFHCL